eukprot:m.263734 g.263734  ORF g.263734 m.263734 type:complete len:429 (+) comp27178_c0_seq1:189-1475(+)
MSCKLYTFANNPRAFKIQVAAAYAGVAVDVVPNFKLGETNKTEDFTRQFPFGKVPAFLTADGQPLFETNAICDYITKSGKGNTGRDSYEEALIQQWVGVADNEIYPNSCTWVYPTFGIIQYNKTATEAAKESIKKVLAVLNDQLAPKTFLVGERVTLADISVACSLLQLYQQVLEPNFRKAYPHVNRWFTTCVNQPEFKGVLGEVKLATKMAQFDAKAWAETQAKLGGGKGGKKQEKKKTEKKPAEKKQEKKKAAPAEPAAEAPKKPKDPLKDLPKGTFDMDAFKRSYSNEETPQAIEHFWKNFDAENYSIWLANYKYNDELAMTFMSANLVGGMFQRLDKLRKYAFASVCIFGENNNNKISGIWVWRGQKNVFELNEDWQIDSPSYTFEKLDPTADKTKRLVKEYFMWEGEFPEMGGSKFCDGKVFK